MLELVHVAKDYESPAGGGEVRVLRDITLKIRRGLSVAIVGPSGSGKSTLLNIIGGLDYPTSGKVLFNGSDISELSEAELARMRNQQIGFVFQLHHLLPQCTVIENVLVPTLADRSSDREEAEQRAVRLLKRVGLTEQMLHRPGELSGGQRQRVAVVRALINEPVLLLADEPTGSLDAESSQNIAELLIEMNRSEGTALIVVTHSAKLASYMELAMELSDGILKDGINIR